MENSTTIFYSVYLSVYSLHLSHTGGWVRELKEFLGEDVVPFGFGARNWERESKTVRKMVQVKEWGGGGGWGRKEGKTCRQTLEF